MNSPKTVVQKIHPQAYCVKQWNYWYVWPAGGGSCLRCGKGREAAWRADERAIAQEGK